MKILLGIVLTLIAIILIAKIAGFIISVYINANYDVYKIGGQIITFKKEKGEKR